MCSANIGNLVRRRSVILWATRVCQMEQWRRSVSGSGAEGSKILDECHTAQPSTSRANDFGKPTSRNSRSMCGIGRACQKCIQTLSRKNWDTAKSVHAGYQDVWRKSTVIIRDYSFTYSAVQRRSKRLLDCVMPRDETWIAWRLKVGPIGWPETSVISNLRCVTSRNVVNAI
jgi:hypothetical protein